MCIRDRHHDEIDSLPDDLPLIVIANEFFDALPVHQYVATKDGWRERIVVRGGNGITAVSYTHLDVYKRQVQISVAG